MRISKEAKTLQKEYEIIGQANERIKKLFVQWSKDIKIPVKITELEEDGNPNVGASRHYITEVLGVTCMIETYMIDDCDWDDALEGDGDEYSNLVNVVDKLKEKGIDLDKARNYLIDVSMLTFQDVPDNWITNCYDY